VSPTLRRSAVALTVGLAAVGGAAAALYLMPVSVALGPCLRDWTNATAWRPRPSPLRTARLRLGDGVVQVCYGQPSARGRVVFGGLVPWDTYWRLGANEPTRLFTNRSLRVGTLLVPPGRYALYAVPEPGHWEVAVNRSRSHWGTDFSDRVLRRELGRITVPSDTAAPFVAALRLDLVPGQAGDAHLVIRWERTRVEVPLTPVPDGTGN